MSIDEVLEKSKIEFPITINLKEAEKILEYIAKELPANIHYKVSYNKSLTYFVDTLEKRDGIIDLSADISRENKGFAHGIIKFQQSKIYNKFSSLKFQTIPRYNLEEYGQEIKQLWGDTRKIVKEYLLKIKK